MYRLSITKLANQDLDEIITYISGQLDNSGAAARLLDDIEQCYSQLRENPLMYELCRDQQLAVAGYRKIPIHSYVLIYKADSKNSTVTILRLFYGGRDYTKLI